MDQNAKRIYDISVAKLKNNVNVVNVNVLEYVIVYLENGKEKNIMYQELSKFFKKEIVNVVISLVTSIRAGNNVTYDEWQPYMDAIVEARA